MIKIQYICDNCKRTINDGATIPNMPTLTFTRFDKEDLHYCRHCAEVMHIKLSYDDAFIN